MHDQCLLPTNNRVPYFASLSRLFSLFDLLKDKSASWQPRGASRHSTTLVRPDSVLFAERTEEQILLSRRTGFRAGPRVAALGRCLPRADLDQVLPTSSSIADHAAFVLCERERERARTCSRSIDTTTYSSFVSSVVSLRVIVIDLTRKDKSIAACYLGELYRNW